MEKLLFFAFIVSPGVLFAFLRVPEPPLNLTLAARTPCQVATVYLPSRKTEPGAASGEVGRFASLLGDVPRKLNW